MINTFEIYEELAQSFGEANAKLLVKTISSIYEDLKNTVTKTEFNELKEIVRELSEAQKRTEQRVEELAEAQKRTEQRVEELAEAQKRTEITLNRLIKEFEDIKVQVGGLSMAVGYGIEDKLIPLMRDFVKKEYNGVVNLVERRNIRYPDGKYDEINIYIEAIKDGVEKIIVGECKAQPSKKDLKKFDNMIKRISKYLNVPVHGFIVAYTYSPEIEDLLKEEFNHLKAYKTYEVERIANN